ncbi:MAG: PaaI family thioesterase [Haloarculaceae archaeon]
MTRTEHHRKLERMFLGAPCNRGFDVDITIESGAAELRLAAEASMHHPAGGVHGAYYFKLLDDAAFFAANSLVEDAFLLTTDFNLYLERPVSSGDLTATGAVVNENPRQTIAEAVCHDEDGNELARGSGTFARSSVELTPDIGYE